MIATLYDIHGNLAALDAVLAEVPEEATIVVGGDISSGGPEPAAVLERLRALGDRVLWLRGNADRELGPGEEGGEAPDGVVAEARAALSQEQLDFLLGLPPSVEAEGVFFCHATPRNDLDIFTERTPEEALLPLFAAVTAPTVVVGHTHTQFERKVGEIRVLNSGSVGRPYEDRAGAYWMLDLEPRFTPYDGAPEPEAGREEAVGEFEEMAVR
jgi:putative phosphoesterase